MLNQSSERDFSLDILRTLSCVMVLGVHLGQHVVFPGAFGVFFAKGSTGVGFFFILSGYLSCVSLERLHAKYSSHREVILVFWIKKLLRILPLYYIVMLFYMILYYSIGEVPKDNTGLYWIKYFLLVNAFIRSDNMFWNNLGAVWSISCFVFFYLICPFCYNAIRRYWMAWTSVIAAYGLLKYIDSKEIYNLPLRWLFYFMLGILIYRTYKEHKEIFTLAILLVLALFCILTENGTTIIASLLAASFIIATRNLNSDDSFTFVKRIIQHISMISYSIYLIHPAVIEVLDKTSDLQGIAYGIVMILCTMFFSILSYHLIEKKTGDLLMKAIMKVWNVR